VFSLKKNQNRKWQQRPQLYRGKFYFLRKTAQIALAVFIGLSILSLALYLKASDALCIKNVEILGDITHLSRENILTLSEIENGDKLFTVNLGNIQKRILRFNWIKTVRVRRKFPDTIQIHITEREPLAILLTKKMYLTDKGGNIFKKLEKGDPRDLPVITGLESTFIKQYPNLAKTYFDFTVAMLIFLQDQEFYKADPVSEIHFDPILGFTIFTKNRNTEIYYGRNDFVKKQQSLEKFKLSKHYERTFFVRLDLDKPGRVVARKPLSIKTALLP